MILGSKRLIVECKRLRLTTCRGVHRGSRLYDRGGMLLDCCFGLSLADSSRGGYRGRLANISAEHFFEVNVLCATFAVDRVFTAFSALRGRHFARPGYCAGELSGFLVRRGLSAFHDGVRDL